MGRKITPEKARQHKQRWRLKYPEKAKIARDRQRQRYHQRKIPLGYIVEIGHTAEYLYNMEDMSSENEYKILKVFRESYKELIAKGISYKVWKVKRSKFDLVPHED